MDGERNSVALSPIEENNSNPEIQIIGNYHHATNTIVVSK
jgi:hypothetical protein